MFKSIILEGKIPYFQLIRKILLFIALASPWIIFLNPNLHKELAAIGWFILTFVMLIRPLAQVFPEFKILFTLMCLRKELGIFAALAFIAHYIGYVTLIHSSFFEFIQNSKNWTLNTTIGWGILGMTFSIAPLLTSNNFSLRFLKKYWKKIQRLSYLLFFTGAIHIVLLNEGYGIIGVVIVFIFWMMAKLKIKIKLFRYLKTD